ncbi:MAG: zinc-binding alcohol dehydrogenase [Clostridia bacterium]|nr:zinc-binding alcohol dehydrogenase [Clostridia bacterium]
MKSKTIVFTAPRQVAVEMKDLRPLGPEDVMVKMEYTVVSGGTERACLLGMENTARNYPMSLGYCGVGQVEAVGESVIRTKPGDRVLVYHGIHTAHNVIPQADVTVVENDELESLDAAFVIIASMGLGGVRKLELELGESAMVMGLGLLGLFSIQFLRLSGAYPLIAADPNPARRELALKLGADYGVDPTAPDFTEQIMTLTKGKGVKATVEVTGVSAAMKGALEVAAPMGRIALLGCTRVSDCAVDYYTQVHRPGVKLIGAHNFVRPKVESYPHHWTHQDDCKAILDLIGAGRITVAPIVSRVVSPDVAVTVYDELCNDPNFPLGTVFDWRNEA